jgi:BirA family biotin operon repressor/biotin-[acetyl-CoA-carboxylase] ligase
MTTRAEILRLLSDGAFHSGTDLGKQLGVTRAAVCKSVRGLAQSGLVVQSVTGRGYKLDTPLRLLDRDSILKHLGATAVDLSDRLHVLEEMDSTNHHLAALVATGSDINGTSCLAEAQPGGRGRRGKTWVATPYRNLMLSMAWQFPGGPALVSGLSLAAGLAVLQAIEEYGDAAHGAPIGLKWPNDVLWEGRKLAGLLADVQGESAGPTRVILGVGVNGHIAEAEAAQIDQPWADLQTAFGAPIDRNRLAALIIRHWQRMFQEFAEKGLAAFREEWSARHLYHGQRVRLIQGEREFAGTVEGIDEHGGLIVRLAQGRQVFHSGEISMRPAVV